MVTAVIVAHDGAEWLPRVINAVLEQTQPVQRIVAVDTGSRDRSGAVLADLLGPQAVFGMDRDAGYGAAITQALRHTAATVPVPVAAVPGHGDDPDDWAAGPRNTGGFRSARMPSGNRVEWIWLIHDDSEPAPDALAQLLRGASETPGAAVVGPKVLDWNDRRVILEVGVAIDTGGRRLTGTEPREVDQGQHDGDRDTLAVGSAGMLARRDVWDELGGFDPALPLLRDDIDYCWRVHSAGYRVRVITDAVVYHLEASARSRRQLSAIKHLRRADRRHALFVLLANLPLARMVASLAGNLALSAARTLFFLLAKRPEAARDEAAAVGGLLASPGQLARARRRRSHGRAKAYRALRSQIPRAQTVRYLAEFTADTLSPSSRAEAVGSHHASDDPSDDDSLLTDSGLAQRVLTNPGVLLFVGLLVVALVAERSLLGPGPLGGGALVPPWGGVSGLWSEYLAGFHPVGVGSAASTPPYVAVMAALATILGGKPWLAVALILLGCVPLSGLTAYLASRRVSESRAIRVWLAATYALLPVASGAVAGGRLGTALIFILLPCIATSTGRMLSSPPRRARRAAWATGLLIAIAAAFVPLVWLVAVVIAVLAWLTFSRARRAMALNLAIVSLVPPILLAPWTLSVAEHPATLLLEAGLLQPGMATRDLPASSLLLLNPGGPGTPPVWAAAGLLLAALAALLMRVRGFRVAVAWGVALSGLLAAIVVSRFIVTPAGGGAAVPAWPGVALLFAAVGLLLAVAAAGEGLHARYAAGGLGKIAAVATALVACSAPLLAAAFWMINGVSGPVARIASPVLPEFVSVSSVGGLRTLVLRPSHGTVGYTVLRGTEPLLGSEALTEPQAAAHALQQVVAAMAAPDGNETGNVGQSLAQFAIGYVLLPSPVEPGLARLLDGVAGLRPESQTSAFELWRVTGTVARASVTEPDGSQVALPSGSVSVTDATAPTAGGTLVLAEPASTAWHASLDGHALTALSSPVYGWAQGFRLPAGGGTLSISRQETGRGLIVALELLAVAVVTALALPGAKESARPASATQGSRSAQGTGSRSAQGGRGGASRRAAAAGQPGRGSHAAAEDQPVPAVAPEHDEHDGQPDRPLQPARSAAGAGRRGIRGRETRLAPSARRAQPGRRRRSGHDPAGETGPRPALPGAGEPGYPPAPGQWDAGQEDSGGYPPAAHRAAGPWGGEPEDSGSYPAARHAAARPDDPAGYPPAVPGQWEPGPGDAGTGWSQDDGDDWTPDGPVRRVPEADW